MNLDWCSRFPGSKLIVFYNDLVNHTEREIRRILNFLDLPTSDKENEKLIHNTPYNANYVNYFEDALFIFTEPRNYFEKRPRNSKFTKRIRSSFRNSFSKLKLSNSAKQQTTQKKSLPKTLFSKYFNQIFKIN